MYFRFSVTVFGLIWSSSLVFVIYFQEEFWTDTKKTISRVYEQTDDAILCHDHDLGRGGSTAVTAILINGEKLWIANVGDSRAVLSKRGKAIQMTTDHEPSFERSSIEKRGGFVSNMPGWSVYSTIISVFRLSNYILKEEEKKHRRCPKGEWSAGSFKSLW